MLTKLYNRPLTGALEDKRLDLLINQTTLSGYTSIIVSIGLSHIMANEGQYQDMLIWIKFNLILILIRVLVYARIQRQRQQGSKCYSLYGRIINFSMLLSGIGWGIAFYLFLPDTHNIELFITFISIILIITSASMPTMAPSVGCCLALLLPIMVGTSVRVYELQYEALFKSLVLYFLFLAVIAIRLNREVIHTLATDIENERLVASITIEKEIAEQANIEKSQFLAAASHDLRQPLNSLGLFLYALREKLKQNSTPQLVTIVKQMDNAYLALRNLFDSLLELSRLDAGNLYAEKKSIYLSDILRPLTEEMREQALAKGIQLHYQPSGRTVQTDPILLIRIMRNLISNAIKYTDQGEVQVIEKQEGDQVLIQVNDTGIGIPESEFNNIFNEYHQLANKKRDRRQGIGLGLSLVKKMSALLGTSVSVESVINKGSQFSLQIPIASCTEPAVEISLEPVKPLNDLKVLVVDDEPDILIAMKLLLLHWQCQVNVAETYQQALSLAQDSVPDIILCDYRLQESMTGIDVIEKLRQETRQTISAIIITGDTNPAVLKSIQTKGFHLLSKPIQPSILQKEIELIISK